MQDKASSNLQVAEHVARMLSASDTPALVIGAVALAAHRYVRTFTESLRSEDFDAELHEPDADDPWGGVIDISGDFGLVQVINFEERFSAVIRDALEGEDIRIRPGSMLRIMPIPQLVALKLYAGGWKAQADIVELLRRNPEVDADLLRETCRRYRLRGLDRLLDELQR